MDFVVLYFKLGLRYKITELAKQKKINKSIYKVDNIIIIYNSKIKQWLK